MRAFGNTEEMSRSARSFFWRGTARYRMAASVPSGTAISSENPSCFPIKERSPAYNCSDDERTCSRRCWLLSCFSRSPCACGSTVKSTRSSARRMRSGGAPPAYGERVLYPPLHHDLQKFVHLDVVRFRLKPELVPHRFVFGHHIGFVEYGRRRHFGVDGDLAPRDAVALEAVVCRFKFPLFFRDALAQIGKFLFRGFEFFGCNNFRPLQCRRHR